jgi:hypothetical protein
MENMTEQPGTGRRRGSGRALRPKLRPGAVIAIALGVFFAVALLAGCGGSKTPTVLTGTAATSVSASELTSLAGSTGIPIFWAGPKTGYTYEYTRTTANRVFLRYLPLGVAVGSSQAYLTIGTYPLTNAYKASQTVSQQPGEVKVPLKGGLAFYSKSSPTHVYLAYPGLNVQVEVYDPAGGAQALVTSGQIGRVSGSLPAAAPVGVAAHAVSPAGLRRLAAVLKHPIYWAGAKAGLTYEVTQTASGEIFLRYLPAGVAVGVKQPYLTIGTYPVPKAYSVVAGLAKKPGSVRLTPKGRAIAFYNKSRPTNVYLAYPGASVEIEVYESSALGAQKLAASAQLTSVG